MMKAASAAAGMSQTPSGTARGNNHAPSARATRTATSFQGSRSRPERPFEMNFSTGSEETEVDEAPVGSELRHRAGDLGRHLRPEGVGLRTPVCDQQERERDGAENGEREEPAGQAARAGDLDREHGRAEQADAHDERRIERDDGDEPHAEQRPALLEQAPEREQEHRHRPGPGHPALDPREDAARRSRAPRPPSRRATSRPRRSGRGRNASSTMIAREREGDGIREGLRVDERDERLQRGAGSPAART